MNINDISILCVFANDVVFIIICLKVKSQLTIFLEIRLYLLRLIFASSKYDVIFANASHDLLKSVWPWPNTFILK